ncbi:MAG: hydrogenase maturation nickel metallochaperone HypA [Candidatus Woesearchaeota archaeon]|nr:MAG: hydrogenase maturation nickel metallochaperone HypA [Candidatus Woesearchaeota archaeon]
MHETIIGKQILEAAEAESKKAGKKIKGLVVEVGDLGHLPLEELKEVFDKMSPYPTKYVRKKALVKCEACAFKGEPDILQKAHDFNIYVCPKCGEVPNIISGDQIILKEVELE